MSTPVGNNLIHLELYMIYSFMDPVLEYIEQVFFVEQKKLEVLCLRFIEFDKANDFKAHFIASL